jgi:cyclic pyranopterin phosphate synthase
MSEKVIPVTDLRHINTAPAIPAIIEAPTGRVADTLGRPLHDLRISVTDRCNFRCVYCMPKEVFDKDYAFLPHASLLSFEEITRIARLFVAHGVEKIRLTGGEPLLRKNIENLIAMLADLKTPDGRELDLTLTTNGSLLAKKAQALKDAGLKRVTVSLDSLDDAIFRRMNDVDFPVADVLRGIDVAHRVGLGPVKINMVVKGGMNDGEILPMARHFKDSPFILRFIEYMDVGTSNGWRMDEVIPAREVVRRIAAEMPLEAIEPNYLGETALS